MVVIEGQRRQIKRTYSLRMQAMSEPSAWFEREFDFPSSTALFPNLCARLRGTPARAEDILRDIEPSVLKWRPAGKWSAQENLGHLLDLEPLWLVRVEDYILGHQELTPTDLLNRQTDRADHNEHALVAIQTEFRVARQTLMDRLEHLDVSQLTHSIVHPRLQVPMHFLDHLYFVAEHDDHHLAAIWGILKRYTKDSAERKARIGP
jgi:uncharacterized damage-inducible protein DinB